MIGSLRIVLAAACVLSPVTVSGLLGRRRRQPSNGVASATTPTQEEQADAEPAAPVPVVFALDDGKIESDNEQSPESELTTTVRVPSSAVAHRRIRWLNPAEYAAIQRKEEVDDEDFIGRAFTTFDDPATQKKLARVEQRARATLKRETEAEGRRLALKQAHKERLRDEGRFTAPKWESLASGVQEKWGLDLKKDLETAQARKDFLNANRHRQGEEAGAEAVVFSDSEAEGDLDEAASPSSAVFDWFEENDDRKINAFLAEQALRKPKGSEGSEVSSGESTKADPESDHKDKDSAEEVEGDEVDVVVP